MRYALAWAAALVAAMLGSASLITTLIPAGTVEAAATLDWGVNARAVPDSFVGVSVSAADRGSGLVLPPDPGQPSGATHPQAITGTAVLRASMLRFPDDVSQSYHWNFAYGTSTLDTDRFEKLRELAGVPDAMLTVNMMEGASDEATNWVAYTNSPSGTQFGHLRSDRGSPDPFNIRYWLLGEDITSRPDVYPSARSYVEAAIANATAMKVVSPDIKIGLWIAPGSTEVERNWNDALSEALRDLGPGQGIPADDPAIDFLAVAVTVEVPDRPVTDATLFDSLYGFAADRARAVLEQAERSNQQLRVPLPLAVYRYDLQFAEDGWNQDKGDSIGATIAIQGMLNEFMRHDSLFTTIYRGLNTDSYTAVLKVTTRYDLPYAKQFELNPVGEILASFGQYLAGTSVQVEYTGLGATLQDASRAFYHAPALGHIGAQERIPLASIASCFDLAQGQMVIFASSRALRDTIVVHVKIQGMDTHTLTPITDAQVRAVVQEVWGPTLASDRYTGFDPVTSTGMEVHLPVTEEPGSYQFDLTLKPHSVSTVVFTLNA